MSINQSINSRILVIGPSVLQALIVDGLHSKTIDLNYAHKQYKCLTQGTIQIVHINIE
jgi:hypothetical protein